MKIRGAIFDMDGTLTDSMHVWKTVGSEFLKSLGKTPLPDLDRRFTSMSVFDAVRFIKKEYGVSGSDDELTDKINRSVEKKYISEVFLKDGAKEFVEYLHSLKIPMCVATATDKYMADAALSRLGVRHYFLDIFTSRDIGSGKDTPKIFLKAAEALGSLPSETAVFEDSVVAVRTASKAGFKVFGVADASFAYAWDEVERLSDMSAPLLSGFMGYFDA